MLKYDIAVIGGGIAGYCAAIRSQQRGQKTVLVSQGQSALHFSSGSIDVLARLPTGEAVDVPFDAIADLQSCAPQHPYSKVGREALESSLHWFEQMLAVELPLVHQPDYANHWRITPLGTLKATWMSQSSVYRHRSAVRFRQIVIAAIEGFRDFQPQVLKDNLHRHPDFAGIPIRIVYLRVPGFEKYRRNPYELRSIDIARLLKQDEWLKQDEPLKQASARTSLCEQLRHTTRAEDLVILPAVMGNGDGHTLMHRLRSAVPCQFHEVPTMPPSLMGIRIEEALNRIFIQSGGIHLKGDQVVGGDFEENCLARIHTRNLPDMPISAGQFIMATGSYFSQGLRASPQTISEPVFGLEVTQNPQRSQWRHAAFFSVKTHPFMTFGVTTNAIFNPIRDGRTIENLYCCGSMLAGYDPVYEGCGGGVAIATAYAAIEQCLMTPCPETQREVLHERAF